MRLSLRSCTLLLLLQSVCLLQLRAAAPAPHPLSLSAPNQYSSRPPTSSQPELKTASPAAADGLSALPELQSIQCGSNAGNQSVTVTCAMGPAVTLTVRGLSFGVLQSWGELDVHLSSQSQRLPAISSGGVVLLSDTALSIPSLWLLRSGLLPLQYAGQPLQLSFSHEGQRSNAINVGFSSPAPPNISLISRLFQAQAACALPLDPTHVDRCVPGVSALFVLGQNFWPSLRLRVQGHDCRILQSADNRIDFELPIVPDYEPGTAYELTVIAAYDVWPGLNVTLTAAVAFDESPVLLGAAACIDTGRNGDLRVLPQLKCGQGARVTFLVYGLPLDGSVTVLLSAWGDGGNFSCVDPVYVNSSALTCSLPLLPPAALASVAGEIVEASLAFSGSHGISRSNGFRSVLWDSLDAPFVSAVSGCGVTNSAALLLPQCMPGESITLFGRNFLGNGTGGVYIVQDVQGRFTSRAQQPASAQPTQLVVSMPQLSQYIRYNRSFTLSVRQSWRHSWSNTFTVHMAPHLPWGGHSSTGQERHEESMAEAILSQGVIAAVIVGSLLVIILSVAAVLRWRGRYCSERRKEEELQDERQGLYYDLHEPGHPDYDR